MRPSTQNDWEKEYLCNPVSEEGEWRVRPCECKQKRIKGFWETIYRCPNHQKIVDKVESSKVIL